MISAVFSRIASTFALCALLAILLTVPAHAQKYGNASSAEDIAIAFFKTGGTNPDFDEWAKNAREYKVASPARAPEALEAEKQRLFKKWRAWNTEESILTVSGAVQVELKAVTIEDGTEEYWMYMTFPQGEITYFPYKFLDYNFAVIPQQIENLMIQQLQKEQYALFLKSFAGNSKGSGVLSLQLKPARAYMQQPYIIDKKEQWALLSDIATMSLFSDKSGQPMWTYGSDWYVSPVTQDLRDLYQQPGENTAE